jgi:hypothetical protein
MSLETLRNLSVKQLNRAARIKGRIEKLETQLSVLFGDSAPKTRGPVRRRRRMSAAAKAKIAAAARKRWAKWRAQKSK